MSERNQVPMTTRGRMLEAAISIWQNDPLPTLFGGFTVSRVASEAGVTRATFYSYWPSIIEYLDDLLEAVTARELPEFSEREQGAGRSLKSGLGSISESFFTLCDAQIRSLVEDPQLRLRLGLLSKLDEPAVAEGLRSRYAALEDQEWATMSSVLTSWGREVRPPYRSEHLQAIHGTLRETLAARHIIDPERAPIELYGRLCLGILLIFTRPVDDDRSVDDVVGLADFWPLTGRKLAASALEEGPRIHITAEMVRSMTSMARRELVSVAWEDLTLADVARTVGAHEYAAEEVYVSKGGLGMSILALSSCERLTRFEPTGEPLADLRAMLDICREELARRPAVVQSVLAHFSRETRFPSRPFVEWNPALILGSQVRRAKDAGLLKPEIDPDDLTWALLRVLLFDRSPGVLAHASGPDSAELVLRGAELP